MPKDGTQTLPGEFELIEAGMMMDAAMTKIPSATGKERHRQIVGQDSNLVHVQEVSSNQIIDRIGILSHVSNIPRRIIPKHAGRISRWSSAFWRFRSLQAGTPTESPPKPTSPPRPAPLLTPTPHSPLATARAHSPLLTRHSPLPTRHCPRWPSRGTSRCARSVSNHVHPCWPS